MRTIDSMMVAILLITPIFLGSIFLLVDIPIWNRISPVTLEFAYAGLGLGLIFGVCAGGWYTKAQLRILAKNYEFKGLGLSKKTIASILVATGVFAAFSLLVIYYHLGNLANSIFLFGVSATFTLCITRIAMVNSWQKREEKIVIQEKNKFYVIPYPPKP